MPSQAETNALADAGKWLGGSEGVSTFELVTSALPDALLSWLTARDAPAAVILTRGSAVLRALEGVDGGLPGLHALVTLLHGAVGQLEALPAALHDVVGAAQGLKMLTRDGPTYPASHI